MLFHRRRQYEQRLPRAPRSAFARPLLDELLDTTVRGIEQNPGRVPHAPKPVVLSAEGALSVKSRRRREDGNGTGPSIRPGALNPAGCARNGRLTLRQVDNRPAVIIRSACERPFALKRRQGAETAPADSQHRSGVDEPAHAQLIRLRAPGRSGASARRSPPPCPRVLASTSRAARAEIALRVLRREEHTRLPDGSGRVHLAQSGENLPLRTETRSLLEATRRELTTSDADDRDTI